MEELLKELRNMCENRVLEMIEELQNVSFYGGRFGHCWR